MSFPITQKCYSSNWKDSSLRSQGATASTGSFQTDWLCTVLHKFLVRSTLPGVYKVSKITNSSKVNYSTTFPVLILQWVIWKAFSAANSKDLDHYFFILILALLFVTSRQSDSVLPWVETWTLEKHHKLCHEQYLSARPPSSILTSPGPVTNWDLTLSHTHPGFRMILPGKILGARQHLQGVPKGPHVGFEAPNWWGGVAPLKRVQWTEPLILIALSGDDIFCCDCGPGRKLRLI